MKRRPLILLILLLLVVPGAWFVARWRSHPPGGQTSATGLSPLAPQPEWARLDPYQGVVTRAEFELLLTTVFTCSDAWRGMIKVDDSAARIDTGRPAPDSIYQLRFRSGSPAAPAPRYWRAASELPPAPVGKPLDGVRIAIDPGHIGGEWARVEERDLVVPGQAPVREGDLTLAVARLLKPRLEALGASVVLVRENGEPVTPLRPADLRAEAAASLADNSATSLCKLADRLFYRTAEIRARAERVNLTVRPDLVLCLHFNADSWGAPDNPLMVDRSHLHLLVNGGYSDAEVGLADQRFAMLHRLLQGTHAEEVHLASAAARAMARATGLPPFQYPAGGAVRAIPGEPYVWARNLLANRLYECPVIFTEPYVMNARGDYARIQAGDYEGLREIQGVARPSIFREYADGLTKGLEEHFTSRRPPQ